MRLRSLLVAFFVVFILGCGHEEPSVQQKETVATSQAPQEGGTLIRRLMTDIVTLNPVCAKTSTDRYVQKYLYTPIVYLDRQLQPAPGLAKSWTISPDGLTYRFVLNEKATFSDDSPVRASDVLFTLRKIVDPASDAPQVAGLFEELDLSRTKVIDEHTIDVAFRRPLASQLVHFADVYVLPEATYNQGNFNNDYNDVAVGSGPYRLIRREHGKEIVVELRDRYWREKPHIQTVIFKVIVDHATAWNALKLREIDETIISSDNWVRERTNPELTRIIDFQRFYRLNYNFIAWNNRDPILADKNVRRALAMCVPVDAIIDGLYHGTARSLTGPFTPDEYAYDPSVKRVPFDPVTARHLLNEAGWSDHNEDGLLDKNGESLSLEMLIIAGNSVTTQIMQALQSELKKIGVILEIRSIDSASLMQQIRKGDYQGAYLAWELDADPDPHSIFHSTQFPPHGQNYAFYANPEADRLIDQARRELDPEKRRALYWRLHALLADDQPFTWTVQVSMKWGVNKRLHGVATSKGYGLFQWYPGEFDWWLAHETVNAGQ